MKPKRIILFIFVVVFAQLIFAKDDYYGNIKLRSIGVGCAPQTKKTQHFVLQNNSDATYMHYYGKTDDSRIYSMSLAVNYSELKVGRMMSKDSEPFENDVITTGNKMYAFPSNPNDPGVTPIGDAVPFVVLLALGYVFVRIKK